MHGRGAWIWRFGLQHFAEQDWIDGMVALQHPERIDGPKVLVRADQQIVGHLLRFSFFIGGSLHDPASDVARCLVMNIKTRQTVHVDDAAVYELALNIVGELTRVQELATDARPHSL